MMLEIRGVKITVNLKQGIKTIAEMSISMIYWIRKPNNMEINRNMRSNMQPLIMIFGFLLNIVLTPSPYLIVNQDTKKNRVP